MFFQYNKELKLCFLLLLTFYCYVQHLELKYTGLRTALSSKIYDKHSYSLICPETCSL